MMMKTWKKRVFLISLSVIHLIVFFLILQHFDMKPAYSEDRHALDPRVPADKLATVKALKNPTQRNDNSVAKGKEIFHGKGVCANCHGEEGDGQGPLATSFNPRPRDFTDEDDLGWHEIRTDGEIFWAISKGTAEGMIPYEDMLSEEERWLLVDYIRSLKKSVVANHK